MLNFHVFLATFFTSRAFAWCRQNLDTGWASKPSDNMSYTVKQLHWPFKKTFKCWESTSFASTATEFNSWAILRSKLIVMGRVYPNPKTRRVLDVFSKPEATRTRSFQDFVNPELPEPDIFWIFYTRNKPEPEVQTRG